MDSHFELKIMSETDLGNNLPSRARLAHFSGGSFSGGSFLVALRRQKSKPPRQFPLFPVRRLPEAYSPLSAALQNIVAVVRPDFRALV
jgi:hypothetical protein